MNALLQILGWRRKTIRSREKSETSQDLVLFNEVPWNNVDMQLHFDAVKINKKDAESMLSVQNFSDNGTFLVRLDVDDLSQNNLMLSFVYNGRIHHHKIILMTYFNRYSYCLENGGINFPSVATLIKCHDSKMTLPLPCILKGKKEKRGVVDLVLKSSTFGILPFGTASPRLVRSRALRVRSKGPEGTDTTNNSGELK